MSRFKFCLSAVFAFEGGYVNDPTDRGGATNKGITQSTFDAWQDARKLPRRSVIGISDIEVAAIYHQSYWTPCHGDDLHPPLDLVVFDAAVQHGPARAIKWLQAVVGAAIDGMCGDRTLCAVNDYLLRNHMPDLIDAYQDTRAAFYQAIIARDPTQKKYQKGWANRMNALQDMIVQDPA